MRFLTSLKFFSFHRILIVNVVFIIIILIYASSLFVKEKDDNSEKIRSTTLWEGPQTRVLKREGHHWMELKAFCIEDYNYEKIMLKTPRGETPMYIHPVGQDSLSDILIERSGLWDEEEAVVFNTVLHMEPKASLIDIGSQLGLYSLYAAKMGRDVIAVDPFHKNVRRLCRSVQEGNLTGSVTILFANLSNFRGDDVFESPVLLSIQKPINMQKAIMKIDADGDEFKILNTADVIFAKVDVRNIIMEWAIVGTNPRYSTNLVELLVGYGFLPWDFLGNKLEITDYRYWPWDVHWMKQT